uniref:Trihydroxynaphthalene reductase ) n=1 Tax=Ganoderma boninense TaxID=34458 RepID=A0A5K1K800_9APHY|nr:Trihydroxynaphthalene reductase (EC (T3HN reductase) [Ganoderma boninense]
MSSDSGRHPKARVRAAVPTELEDVACVLTRAFVNDPAMNWFGGVKEPVRDLDNPGTRSEQKTVRNQNWFQRAAVKATFLINGFIDVVVIPGSSSESKGEKEEIVAVAIWFPPGESLDLSPVTFVRAGLLRVIWGWGFSGGKRMLVDFSPAIEDSLAKSFKGRGLDRQDSWYLMEIVVDPVHQGKGYTTMLMDAGFQRTTPKPVHLEATKARTRDIYAHYGFEIDEEHQFGVGAVDMNGLKARGDAATGYPEWVMTKVRA